VNRKVFSGVLAGIGMLALSTTVAQASGGGSPSALTSFLVCKSISGEDAAQRVDVDSTLAGAGWGFNLQNVRIGNATLACAFARLFPANSTHTPCPTGVPPAPGVCNEISPQTDTSKLTMKCYAISTARGQTGRSTPPPSYDVTDALVGSDPDVTGSSVAYVCGPSKFQQNP
jgi:hypothetical protein